ncbi:hypothetical protein M8J77_021371 [Diaphorina citri]|nr:hypothetical protein M8J77_021371 [Diaphorina citri]
MEKINLTTTDATDRIKWRQGCDEAKYRLEYKWPWQILAIQLRITSIRVQWITSRCPPPVQLSRPSNHPGPNSLMDQSCRDGAAPGPGDGDVVANANNNNFWAKDGHL